MDSRHNRQKNSDDLVCTFLLKLLLLFDLTGFSSSVLAQRPLPQTIIFSELPATTLDASPLTLSARASSMLEVSFHSVTLNICNVNRNLLTLIRTGVCRIIARQEGNERYRRALGVMRYFMVRPGVGSNPVSGVMPGSGAGVTSGDKGNIAKPAAPPEITPKTSATNPTADDSSGSGAKEEFYGIVTDQNHTPRQLIDVDDRVVWEWDGEPFGSAPPNGQVGGKGEVVFNLRFPGQYFDVETNLYYNYFRDYDPATGRYVQSDLIGLNGGISTYEYVEGNPFRHIDPQGLATCVLTFSNGSGRLKCDSDNMATPNASVDIPVASGNNGNNLNCKNNADCDALQGVGPIPNGWWVWNGDPTGKPNGKSLAPLPGTTTFGRSLLRSHSCLNAFGPSRSAPFCSEGCITGNEKEIKALNKLLDAEPNSRVLVTNKPFWD